MFCLDPSSSKELLEGILTRVRLSDPDQNHAGHDKECRNKSDSAEGFLKEQDADQDTDDDADLPDRHGVTNRRQVETIAEGQKGSHHDRTAAKDQTPVFTQFRTYQRTIFRSKHIKGHQEQHNQYQDIGEIERRIVSDPALF